MKHSKQKEHKMAHWRFDDFRRERRHQQIRRLKMNSCLFGMCFFFGIASRMSTGEFDVCVKDERRESICRTHTCNRNDLLTMKNANDGILQSQTHCELNNSVAPKQTIACIVLSLTNNLHWLNGMEWLICGTFAHHMLHAVENYCNSNVKHRATEQTEVMIELDAIRMHNGTALHSIWHSNLWKRVKACI